MKISIVGKGYMGSALGTLATRSGHSVVFGLRDLEQLTTTVIPSADMVILAIPYAAALELVSNPNIQAALSGKIVVDITNPLAPDYKSLIVGYSSSAAEEIAAHLKDVRLIKAFNTIFDDLLRARVAGEAITASVFCAGDDADAKTQVLSLISAMGLAGVDAGPLRNARYLEPISVLMLQLANHLGHGTRIGFQLIHLSQPLP